MWIAYERAVFRSQPHRVANFITGIVTPHAKRAPENGWIRLVLEWLGGVKAALG
ncbi:hypothetical protein [Streptomyces sp. NPDC058295]|uniref:hypothetical protein n=1 Tax=Streptomyces sp. NPDC058295 TaxID=3346431 RepID=UPI0036E93D56